MSRSASKFFASLPASPAPMQPASKAIHLIRAQRPGALRSTVRPALCGRLATEYKSATTDPARVTCTRCLVEHLTHA